MAFRDVNPQAPVHVLVIPKKHIENIAAIEESDGEILAQIHRCIRKVAQMEELAEGFRVVVNTGQNGGQTVPHLHYHVVGGRPMKWPPG